MLWYLICTTKLQYFLNGKDRVTDLIITVAHKCNTQIYFKTHKYISKHTNIFQNTQIYFKTHKYISKHTNIFQNTQIYFKTHKYISKHTNIFQNTQIYFRTQKKCRNTEKNVGNRQICPSISEHWK